MVRVNFRQWLPAIAGLFLLGISHLVAQLPYKFAFTRTPETPQSVIYDPSHQCFYGTVPGENAVYAISETTGALLAKASVPSAHTMDLSTDGSRLYVTSSGNIIGDEGAQGYFIIDTASFHVIDFVQPSQSYLGNGGAFPLSNTPQTIAALSNGKVAYAAWENGATGNATVFLNDPSTNVAIYAGTPLSGNVDISKSFDGSTFVSFSGDSAGQQLAVYDAASATYVANVRTTLSNSGDVVMSPDGQHVLIGGEYLFDRSLNLVATLNSVNSSIARSSQGSIYSPDGTRIYSAVGSHSLDIAVYNAQTNALLGYVPIPLVGGISDGIAASNSGKVLVMGGTGFLEIDASNPSLALPLTTFPSVGGGGVTPSSGSASAPGPVTINGSIGFQPGAQVWFNNAQASSVTVVSSSQITAQPPPGTPGKATITIAFPDGEAVFYPDYYTYGPAIIGQDVDAGDSSGGTTVNLFGLGFTPPQVTVGGSSATLAASTDTTAKFKTPAGAVGPAVLQLSSPSGSVNSPFGYQYVSHRLIPSILPFQMVVDDQRNQMYAADAVTGNTLAIDANTLAVRTLYSSPASPATALAITPDKSTLLILSYSGQTLDLIDLNTGTHLQTIIPYPANQPSTYVPKYIAATARGTAIVTSDDTSGLIDGAIFEVNLTSGATVPVKLGQQVPTFLSASLLAASADGKRVFTAPDNGFNDGSNGYMDLWGADADYSVESKYYSGQVLQIAVDETGDRLLQDTYTLDPQLRVLTALAPPLASTQFRLFVDGEKLHSSGALAYMPTTAGVEIYDIHHGDRLLAIGSSSPMATGPDNLAVNHAGNRLYLSESAGIGVVDLSSAPLSIGSLTPAYGSAAGGDSVVLRGSGFQAGTTVKIDAQPASVQFVDSTQVILTTPAMTAANNIVSVANPDGTTYSLDAAFDATARPLPAPPVLTSLVPLTGLVDAGGGNVIITGTGFTATSVVYVNGAAVETLYGSSTEVTGVPLNYPTVGQQTVTVVNPPNPTPSNPLYITTHTEAANLLSVTPGRIAAGSPDFIIQAFGNLTFEPNTFLLWNGSALATTYSDANHIYSKVPATLVAAVGTASLSAQTPGYAASSPIVFTIDPDLPSVYPQTTAMSFSALLIGGSETVPLRVSSNGNVPLVITGFSFSDAADFSQTNNCTAPVPPGKFCTVTVAFAPSANASLTGPINATLTIQSNAPPVTVSIAAAAGDYRVAASTPLSSVAAGASASTTIVVNTSGTLSSFTAQFACSGPLPTGVSCSFNPSSVLGANGATTVVSVNTSAGSIAAHSPARASRLLLLSFGVLAFLLYRRPKRRLSMFVLIGLGFVVAISVPGCGGGGGSSGGGTLTGNTPTGSYSITVTATAGQVSRSTTLTLTVNAK